MSTRECGSSPLTRGKLCGKDGPPARERLIPAHAGKTSACQRLPAASRAHPRSRGENCKRPSTRSSTVGSSPLTRGKLLSSFCVGDGGGLIPAHAGKTEADRCPVVQSWAHPRSRGENLLLVLPSGSIQGSSPLTRGKRRARHSCSARRRLIPAHAGKTRPRASSPACTGAHPRSRGENAHPGRSTRHRRWLIPAHAGKTVAGDLVSHVCPAHPRSRGENASLGRGTALATGSSPLTRGKRGPDHRGFRRRGLIPAHAGKTCSWSCPRARSRAHPRSRGENPDAPGIASANWGSSPLTRGKHNCESSFHYLGRLIPAHAGKTGSAGLRWNTDRAHPRSRGKNARHAT